MMSFRELRLVGCSGLVDWEWTPEGVGQRQGSAEYFTTCWHTSVVVGM